MIYVVRTCIAQLRGLQPDSSSISSYAAAHPKHPRYDDTSRLSFPLDLISLHAEIDHRPRSLPILLRAQQHVIHLRRRFTDPLQGLSIIVWVVRCGERRERWEEGGSVVVRDDDREDLVVLLQDREEAVSQFSSVELCIVAGLTILAGKAKNRSVTAT